MKSLPPDDLRIAKGLYTLRQAAWYLDVPVSTLHYWAHRTTTRPPLVTTLPRWRGTFRTIPFIGFAEAYVVKYALDAGVSRNRIASAVEALRQRAGGVEHALATDRVRTDGVEIFLELAEEERGEDLDSIELPRASQFAIRKMLEEQIKRIGFAGDGYAARIELPKFGDAVHVVADPYVAAGQPLLMSGGGVRVKDIRDRVKAGDEPRAVARDFGVKLGEVKELIGHA